MTRRRWLKRLGWVAAGAVVLGFVAFLVAYARSDNDCEALLAAAPANPMKAVLYCEYGSPDVLRLAEIEKPVPGADQLLVKVKAAAVNPLDWHYVRGTPYLMRMSVGLRKPAVTRLGVDFSGIVESVGSGVTRFAPGDEVFGGRTGALGEYVLVGENGSVVPKPPSLSFAQAASIPVAAITALQGLRDRAQVQPGQRVLINGASGGVGTFAVQIAKAYGAHVTGVCSGRNAELVRSLGADAVVDYTKEDFTKGAERYDVIFDNVGNRGLGECRRALTPKGKYILIGGGGPNDHKWMGPLGRLASAVVVSRFVDQQLGMMLAKLNAKDLAVLAEMTQTGKITPVIDRTYTLSEAKDALAYLETGRARGKVIVTVE